MNVLNQTGKYPKNEKVRSCPIMTLPFASFGKSKNDMQFLTYRLTSTIFSGESQSGGQGGQVHESPEHHRCRVQDGRVAGEGGAGLGLIHVLIRVQLTVQK